MVHLAFFGKAPYIEKDMLLFFLLYTIFFSIQYQAVRTSNDAIYMRKMHTKDAYRNHVLLLAWLM